jgi:hypothetical protein
MVMRRLAAILLLLLLSSTAHAEKRIARLIGNKGLPAPASACAEGGGDQK